jgi:hypothetical protein
MSKRQRISDFRFLISDIRFGLVISLRSGGCWLQGSGFDNITNGNEYDEKRNNNIDAGAACDGDNG